MRKLVMSVALCLAASSASAQVQAVGPVSFAVPEGMKYEQNPGEEHASMSFADGKNFLIIVITKPLPPTGDAEANFKSAWTLILTRAFNEAVPSPIYAIKVKGGYPGKFGGNVSNDRTKFYHLETIETPQGVVPILVIASSGDVVNAAWQTLSTFVQGVRVSPGKAQPPKKTIALADMTGMWRTGASSSLSYVDSHTGAYAGSSTVAYSASYDIAANGAYTYVFGGITNGTTVRERSSGVVDFTSDLVLLRDKKGSVTKLRFISYVTAVDGSTIMTFLPAAYEATGPNIGMYADDWVRPPPK
jgi:hypothetical protein